MNPEGKSNQPHLPSFQAVQADVKRLVHNGRHNPAWRERTQETYPALAALGMALGAKTSNMRLNRFLHDMLVEAVGRLDDHEHATAARHLCGLSRHWRAGPGPRAQHAANSLGYSLSNFKRRHQDNLIADITDQLLSMAEDRLNGVS